METTAETVAIERELSIAARPETVWEFLVDPEKAARWMGREVALEPHPGGLYRVDVIPGSVAIGEFVEVDPPRRLVWTWGWEPGGLGQEAPGSTTIEVELIPDGDGTTLRFTHRGLPSAAAGESPRPRLGPLPRAARRGGVRRRRRSRPWLTERM